MCGIVGMFDRDSSFGISVRSKLARDSEERGTNGFGVVHIRRSLPNIVQKYSIFKSEKPYSELAKTKDDEYNLWRSIISHPNGSLISTRGDVTLMISRAAPETECATDSTKLDKTLQPIINEKEDIVLVHNGAISNKIRDQLGKTYEYQTDIDSEAIIASYLKFGRNIKDAMEFICGGVAALMYDGKKDVLYMINDFKPLAVGYLRGDGLIAASTKQWIDKIIEDKYDVKRNGICCWESFYSNYLPGGFIHEIDLQSGIISDIQYSPRYMTNVWDSNKKLLESKGHYAF